MKRKFYVAFFYYLFYDMTKEKLWKYIIMN